VSRAGGIPSQMDAQVTQLRAEFDVAFSRLPTPVADRTTDLLMLNVGDHPCAIRLSEIAEVSTRPVLVAVPTRVPALIGLTARQGSPVAAYDLGLLLGRAPVTPRWLVLAAAEPGVGLAFEHFTGYQRIPSGSPVSAELLDISALIDVIGRFTHSPRGNQEVDA
jgi:chemotaxis signal transduction protein